MKTLFDPNDLKKEYILLFNQYKVGFLQKNPSINYDVACKYAIKMVQKKARNLYNYKQIIEKIDSMAELNEIVLLHKSCAERGKIDNYYNFLNDILHHSNSIFDVGCGLNPCMILPKNSNISRYICYDKDKRIMEILKRLNETYLGQAMILLSDDEWNNEQKVNSMVFDLVLVQKLISNLYYNRNRKTTDKIAKINSKYFFVSGCIWSLSRNISIRNDEEIAIEWFINRYGFQKIKYFETSNEFGWILRKN